MDLFQNENINIAVSKADAAVILKCLKIAKARKKLEYNQDLKKGNSERANGKNNLINNIKNLEHYLHYLIK